MTQLEPTPNAQFWQALEKYIRDRLIEQVAEKPAPKPYEEAGDEAWQEYQHIKQSVFPVEEN